MPVPASRPDPRRRAVLAGLLAAPVAASVAAPAAAAPRSSLIDPFWKTSGADAAGPDHAPWTAFLQRHRSLDANGVALLPYGAVTEEERATLSAYIGALEAADPTTMTRAAAFAYWANLYNAKTVDLVLEAYPVSSIKRVRGGLFGSGPWREKTMTVLGRALSLDDVEHGIMRPIWNDPRIHYAVNCAAIGCPNLQAEAWEPETLEGALDAAARDYVNDPRGAKVANGRLVVSSIYEWFQADFGGDDAGVIAHLAAYAAPELADALKGVDRVWDDEYDWSLNNAG
ncbi:MAG: DUF547 domain-containing protein [Pseudomonadota bacterium]